MSAASHRRALTVERPTRPPSRVTAAPVRTSWFAHVVWATLLSTLSWGLASVVFAMLGIFWLPGVVLLTAAFTTAFWVGTRPARYVADPTTGRGVTAARVAALAVVAVAVVGNGMLPGEHMQTGRDGGTYTATAGWISSQGNLVIDADQPPFSNPEGDGLGFYAAGFHEVVEGGPLYAQFMHVFPAMMASVEQAGGLDLMVRTNALLGGIALLALYAFAERFVRPWLALVAQVALAVNMVFVYFTRAPFSELLMLAMLFGGLWALDHAFTLRDGPTGFVAGMLLGATFLARLDGLVVLLMLAAALLPPVVSGRMRRIAPATLGGIAVTSIIALNDLFVFAPFYVELHVAFLVPLGVAFCAVAVVAALARTGVARRATTLAVRHRARIAVAVASLIIVAAAFAYLVRPSLPVAKWDMTTPIGWLQQREGQPIDEARTYAEQSARWLSWYLGLPALAAGVAGWALLTREAIARRLSRLVPFLLTFSALTVLYVWRPSITPDHIWADRRFLPVVIPGLLVCAVWLIDGLWTWATAPSRRDQGPAARGQAGRGSAARGPSARITPKIIAGDRPRRAWLVHAGLGALVALVVVLPMLRTAPIATFSEQAGYAAQVAAACDALGDRAAVLLLDEEGTAMHWRMTQPLRAHCAIPAAWADASIDDETLLRLASQARDRTLYVLAERRETLADRPVDEPFVLIRHRSNRLAATLTHPPEALESYGLDVLAARVRG